MKRSKHSLSHYKLLTCDMGELVPVGLMEALPGDTFQQSTSLLIRMSPLMAPVMHPVVVRLHHWFVPNRLVYAGWEDFITGGKDGLGSSIPYPTNASPVTPVNGDLWDYMGVPVGVAQPAGNLNMMPIAGFNLIYNHFYRDEDLITERATTAQTVPKISWEKDYFTTSRPWAQKGPMVTLPLGSKAPVKLDMTQAGIKKQIVKNQDTYTVVGDPTPTMELRQNTAALGSGLLHLVSGHNDAVIDPNESMYADLAGATAASVIDFRRALAIQRYQEARSQYGHRYNEYLRYYGIKPSDARLQRPEYLGGGKQTIAFSEVLRTGDSSGTNPIGEMKGHGIAALRSNRYRFFCEEHGYIFTLLSIRPRSMYINGLSRTWSRRTKEDYYQRELELIGQQEVRNREVYAAGTAADAQTFGYQNRYAEYRHEYSNIAGDFRSTLDFWHLGRKFASLPTLNQSFVECDPAKRIFAVQTNDIAWIMASHSVQCRRMVGKQTIGRVL